MSYPSDLTNKQWKMIEGFFDKKDPRGRKQKHSRRTIVNAILYVVKGGIQWDAAKRLSAAQDRLRLL